MDVKKCQFRSPAYCTPTKLCSKRRAGWPDIADKAGDVGTNDMLVSDVIQTNETQVWFIAEHLVDGPLVHADRRDAR